MSLSTTQLAGLAVALGLGGFAVWAETHREDPAVIAGIVAELNASEFGGWFDPRDVLAVVQIESGFKPYAARYEPHLGEASLGLMQVLPSTARDRGYVGSPFGLFDTVTSLRIGMAHLRWTYDFLAARLGTAPSVDQWIGAYNAGVGNVLNRGYWSANYVAKWRQARGSL